MKKIFQIMVTLVIIFALCSGCATTKKTVPGSSPGSVSKDGATDPPSSEAASKDAETSTDTSSSAATDDSTRTKLGGATAGALILGGIGAIIGAVIARDAGAAIGAGIGAALGGLLGYKVGSAVAARKKKYANEEDRLNDLIKIAAKDNKELIDFNTKTFNQIKTMEGEISELKQCYAKDATKIDDMEEKQKEINSLISAAEKQKTNMNNEFNALNEYLESIRQTQQQEKVAQLEQEVTELKKNIEMLDSNNKQMAQMVESLTVRK